MSATTHTQPWSRSDFHLLLTHFEPIVWTTAAPGDFLLQSALAFAENDDDAVASGSGNCVLLAVLSGFHRLVTVGRLAETKVPIYTQLLNACNNASNDIVHMCAHLYRAHPSGRTADTLIRRLNAGTSSNATTGTRIGIMDDASLAVHQLLSDGAQLANNGGAHSSRNIT